MVSAVRLHAEHEFDAPCDAVLDALLDPAFVPELAALPDVGSVELVDHRLDATSGLMAVRLTYDGAVDGIAATVLGSTTPSWVQTYTIDRTRRVGTLTIVPDSHGSFIECGAAIALTGDDHRCRRVIDGSLSIRVPLLGGKAERTLGPAILARIDTEAELLRAWLG